MKPLLDSVPFPLRKIRLGHSPDPDDAFLFYALAQGKIPLNGFEIEHVVEEIERLNQRALQVGEYSHTPPLEVTALSVHAFGFVLDYYQLLPYGASVGEGYGPILVAKKGKGVSPQIKGTRIAVPGRYTTAFLLLQLFEKEFDPVFTPFDQIFRTLEEGEVDFGLLIHEGQLTYPQRGFEKILDLGQWWQEKYRLPLPLGINVIRKDLEEEVKVRFRRLLRKSLDYALAHREEALRYALTFGRGIDPEKGERFVGMYVNQYALELGEKGKEALGLLLELGWKKGFLPRPLKAEALASAL